MINFTKDKSLNACHLTKENLITLISVLETDFPESTRSEDFSISTRTNEIYISEHTIEAFLQHKRLPEILSNLSIDLIGWSSDRKIDKKLYLNFSENYSRLSVSGSSESWVNGKFLQIVNFLKDSRPLLWFLYTPIVYYSRGAILVFLITGIYLIGKKIFTGDITSIGTLLPFGLVSLVIIDSIISKMKHTKLFIKEQQSFSDKYKDILSVIGIISAFFTVIGVIVSLIK